MSIHDELDVRFTDAFQQMQVFFSWDGKNVFNAFVFKTFDKKVCGFHWYTLIVFTLTNSCNPNFPSSRPMPLFLMPQKGMRGSDFTMELTKTDPRMPFGGIKKSGIGRELGKFGLH